MRYLAFSLVGTAVVGLLFTVGGAGPARAETEIACLLLFGRLGSSSLPPVRPGRTPAQIG